MLIDCATYAFEREKALDNILDLSNQIKTVIELEANRQYDGLVFGYNIVPYEWSTESYFFRGRVISVDYWELETKILEY